MENQSMEQRTIDWHAWRKKGIGASDAPVILGVSPWSTPFQLWEEKTGLVKRDRGNWATQRGNDLEPMARAQFELDHMVDAPAMLCEHPKFPWMRASLDGFVKEKNAVLEIKCPGREDHETAKAGNVPEKYRPQLQHQLIVTGGAFAYYYSFYEIAPKVYEGVTVIVEPDVEYCKKLFEAEVAFWNCVVTKTPPALIARDCRKIRNPELNEKLRAYFDAKKISDAADKVTEDLKAEILKILDAKYDHPHLLSRTFKMTKVVRTGNVNYKNVPELKGVDLAIYRAAPSTYWTLSETDEDAGEPADEVTAE